MEDTSAITTVATQIGISATIAVLAIIFGVRFTIKGYRALDKKFGKWLKKTEDKADKAEKVANNNSELLAQLQAQIKSQNQVIAAFKSALDENQEERKAARKALAEERVRYDAKIKTLEEKVAHFEVQQQATLGQQAEILIALEQVVEEWADLKAILGTSQADVIADLDVALDGLKKIVTRKRTNGGTGSLKGKATDADETNKKGD